MIYVTIGTTDFNFNRLMKALELLPDPIKAELIAQIGKNPKPNGIDCFDFCPRARAAQYLHDADILITHGGSTLMEGIIAGKRMVTVPRLKAYDEALNDHQLHLCEKLAQKGTVINVVDMKDLNAAIARARTLEVKKGVKGSLSSEVLKIIESMESE